MANFKLFQIKLSDADVDLINAEGHDAVPHHKAKLDMQFSKSIASKAGKAILDGYYSHVANITADTLEGVFHIGNMGPEENIERLNEMHSVSVADVVQDSNGIMHVVADFGFEKVDIAVEA